MAIMETFSYFACTLFSFPTVSACENVINVINQPKRQARKPRSSFTHLKRRAFRIRQKQTQHFNFHFFAAQSTIQPTHISYLRSLSSSRKKRGIEREREKEGGREKKKSSRRLSVSGNRWPYNIAVQAKVDYDSEIGSEAWNIPPVILPSPSSFHGPPAGPDLRGPQPLDVFIALS